MDELLTDFSFGLLIWQLLILVAIGLWIYCLIDILKSKFEQNDKIVWVLVVVLLPILGSLLYLVIGRKKKVKLS